MSNDILKAPYDLQHTIKNVPSYKKAVQQYNYTVEDESLRESLNRSAVQNVKPVPAKRKDLGVNRSMVVEPSTLQSIIHSQQEKLKPAHVRRDDGDGKPGVKEIETMKDELKSKDLLIQNLRDRLQNLEEKVNGIQLQ